MTSIEQTLNCSSVSTSMSNCLVSISDSNVAKVLPVSKEFLVLFWQRQRFSVNICSAFITSMLVLEYKLWLQLNKSWFIQVTVTIKTFLKSKKLSKHTLSSTNNTVMFELFITQGKDHNTCVCFQEWKWNIEMLLHKQVSFQYDLFDFRLHQLFSCKPKFLFCVWMETLKGCCLRKIARNPT